MRSVPFRPNPFGSLVALSHLPPHDVVEHVRRTYEDRFGKEPTDRGGWYRPDDWSRITYALRVVQPGGRVLDVGLGAGQFVNVLACTGWFDEVHGVDPTRFDKYIEMSSDIRRLDAGIDELPYPDSYFNVVTCMEVLEHLEPDVLELGLAELRRVCRGQLVMSVPFDEPEPIYVGHRRRFIAKDLLDQFPDAARSMLFKLRAPWAMIEEWHGSSERPVEFSLYELESDVGVRRGVAARARVRLGVGASAGVQRVGHVARSTVHRIRITCRRASLRSMRGVQ